MLLDQWITLALGSAKKPVENACEKFHDLARFLALRAKRPVPAVIFVGCGWVK
jgi:hypothetical protein